MVGKIQIMERNLSGIPAAGYSPHGEKQFRLGQMNLELASILSGKLQLNV
jgi:hypothetical protein